MELKDRVLNRLTDPIEIDEVNKQGFSRPVIGMFRRDYVSYMGVSGKPMGPSGETYTVPHWYPSGAQRPGTIARNPVMYNRTDGFYKDIIDLFDDKCESGLEIGHDIGRSTGHMASITKSITVLDHEDYIDWLPLYDSNARVVAQHNGVQKKNIDINWCFGNKWTDEKFDWIKIEFDRVDITIDKAIQSLKPNGKIICIGSREQCQKWLKMPWAKGTNNAKFYEWGKGKTTSFITLSINTNGEKHD